MVAEFLRAMFPRGWQRWVAFFCASLLLTVGIAACSGGGSAPVGSLARIDPDDIADVAPADSTLDKIQSRGTVRVAVPADFPPFGFVNPRMQPIGYDQGAGGRAGG